MTTPCPICQGTGWKPVEREGVHAVTRCDCVLAERTPRQFAVARIPLRYEHCDFDNFDELDESLKQAKFWARRYAEEFRPDTDVGLLFMGRAGVGKTHLGVAVLKSLIVAKGVAGLFYDFRELLKEIQSSYNPISQTSEVAVLEPVLSADVLVLDDFGAVKPSAWVQDTVGYIINARYNDRRPLLLTTNFLDEVARRGERTLGDGTELKREDTLTDRVGERVRSRLHEMCRVVSMGADDFRRRARMASFRP
jgi:DNA replication protein DnaC